MNMGLHIFVNTYTFIDTHAHQVVVHCYIFLHFMKDTFCGGYCYNFFVYVFGTSISSLSCITRDFLLTCATNFLDEDKM